MPLKYLAPYRKTLYLVHFVKNLLCILFDPLTGNLIYQNTQYIKKYRPRGPIFAQLNPKLQKLMGTPFDPSSRQTRAELISYLNDLKFNEPSIPSNPSASPPPSPPPSLPPPVSPPIQPSQPFLTFPDDEFYNESSSSSSGSVQSKSEILSPPLHRRNIGTNDSPPSSVAKPEQTLISVQPRKTNSTVITRLKSALRNFKGKQ